MNYLAAPLALFANMKSGLSDLINLQSPTAESFEWINGLVIDRCYQFTAINYPNKAIRHRGTELWIDAITDDPLFVADSTWKVKHGLSGLANSISLEATNFPGRYVYHYG